MVAIMVGHVMRVRARSLAVWSASLSAGVVLMIAIFPSISRVDFSKLLEAYPKELLDAFGIESAEQYSTAIGYINGELFSLLFPFAIVFLPVGVISHLLPAAEEKHYLDNLLCTPIARWQLVASASVGAALSLAIALLTMFVVSLVSAKLIDVELGAADIGNSCASLWPLASLFGAVGVLMAGAGPGRGRATGTAAGLLVSTYLISVVANFSEFFHDIRWISPFFYYSDWLKDGIDWTQFVGMLVIAAALTALGAALFERRDIAS